MKKLPLLKKHFPPLADILPVFSIIATMFYGWSVVVFLWKLPGWIFYLTLGEIAIIFAFELVTNLMESLIVLITLLLIAAALPSRFFRDDFVIRGSVISLTLIGSMMLIIQLSVTRRILLPTYWPAWLAGAILVAILLVWIVVRMRFLSRVIAWLADRVVIFLYVLLPLSLVAFVVILPRLLLEGMP